MNLGQQLRIVVLLIFHLLFMPIQASSQNDFCYQNIDLTKLKSDHTDSSTNNFPRNEELIIVRTVVHQVYNDNNSMLQSQKIELLIDQLNDYFSATNIDTFLVHPSHRDLIKNTQVKFCLASFDPEGFSTTGITNTKSDTVKFHFEDIGSCMNERWKDSEKGGHTAWPTDRYLNIWIMDNIYDLNIGYPYSNNIPLSNYSFCQNNSPGASLDVSVFSDDGDNFQLESAKVLAHEIGHVLGLLHTYGPYDIFSGVDECDYDDYIEDTPNCISSAICEVHFDTCDEINNEIDNGSNFMASGCMIMFTIDQSERMRTNLQVNMSEVIIEESVCSDLTSISWIADEIKYDIFPNPNKGLFIFECSYKGTQRAELKIFNLLGECVLVKSISSQSTTVQIENQRGLFVAVMSLDGIINTKKFIVQ